MSIRNDGYVNLANAIVEQAAKDYLMYKKRLYILGDDDDPNEIRGEVIRYRNKLNDVRKFFKSKWYKTLTDLNVEMLVRRLDEEFEEWKIEHELKQA